ncbi:MAG: DUF1573 domain-containing protein [Gemmataceae bacterium]|nr:DUF1573 domain-containing protein [Gemmataceae bacterium]
MGTRIVALVGLAVLGGVFATRVFQTRTLPSAETVEQAPPLFVPTSLDLGEVWEAEAHTVQLPVGNHSTEPVRVDGWDRTCACLTVDPSEFTVAPGGTQVVSVRLNLTGNGAKPTFRDATDRPFRRAFGQPGVGDYRTGQRSLSEPSPVDRLWAASRKHGRRRYNLVRGRVRHPNPRSGRRCRTGTGSGDCRAG